MLGDIIRSLRKQAGLSQEDLADGICSAVSISRIENGVQMPSSAILDKILCKLGTGTYQIRNIYYKNEKQLAFEEDAHAVKSIISQNRLFEAKQKLVVLKDLMQDDISNMQYYILLASSIKLYENRNISELIPELKAAIKLTKKRFQYIKKSPINTGQIEDLICLQDFSILFIHLEILNQLLFTN